MPTIELTAKSLEEGRKQAAEKLGVAADAVEVKVLEESKGLFGRVTLRLSATAPEASDSGEVPAPKPARAPRTKAAPAAVAEVPVQAEEAEKPRLARGRARKTAEAVAAAEPHIHSEERTLETAPAEVATGSAPRRLGRKSPPAAAPAAPPKPEAPAETPAPGPRRLGRRGAAPVAATEAPVPNEAKTDEEGDDLVATQEHADRFRREIESLLKASGLNIEVTPSGVEGKYVNLRISGADAAHLIGRSGEVLNSLQYLANLIGKQQHNDGIRVTLDANDYRQAREEVLGAMAHKVAAQVLESGMEALLPALPAYERRVVHRIASEIPGVTTYSEGEEPHRQIVISPAD